MKTTLQNLSDVLGERVQTVKIRRMTVPVRPRPVSRGHEVSNLPDFVEKVNGRCAISGMYIYNAIEEFTGHSLVQQLVEDTDRTLMLLGTDITVITLLSALVYRRTNYENPFEFGITVMYRYAMFRWLMLFCAYFF